MKTRTALKIGIVTVIFLFLGYFMLAAVGVFDTKPYRVVPHGDHNHYVPHDRNDDIPIDAFPTREPADGERITPYGDIVRENDAER